MGKKAIICVDDERMILDSLVEQLERNFGSDYLYECAENTEDAEEIIREHYSEENTVVIIISDWLMPGMKGDEFLIKINKSYPGTIKIMLTGQASIEAINRAVKEADLSCYLYKPWNEGELVAAIKNGVDKIKV